MKKPSLASVALAPADMEGAEASPDDEGGDEYGAAVEELADVMGVPEDKIEAFKAAFQAAVMTCK